MNIERLESRIAPALIIAPNGRSATYDDIDGDHVTLKISKGDLNTALFLFSDGRFDLLNLSSGGFDGANLTFTVKKVATGDGLAHVGLINSTDHDLGKVVIKGDLSAILVGDATTLNDPGLISLRAQSLGRFTAIGSPNGDGTLESKIHGALGSLKLTGDLRGFVNVTGGVDGKIGSVTIGGSIVGDETKGAGSIQTDGAIGKANISHDVQGGLASSTGQILAQGTLKKVNIHGSVIGSAGALSGAVLSNSEIVKLTIGGSVVGGSGNDSGNILSINASSIKVGGDVKGSAGSSSGNIRANGILASVTIGGSLIGGSGIGSGSIFGAATKKVKIGQDVIGGDGSSTGGIQANTVIESVTIGGSVLGGSGNISGVISTVGDIGSVKIGRDLVGSSIVFTDASLADTGEIVASGRIGSVVIGGSIIAGSDNSTFADLVRNATIIAGDDIGSLVVKGSLLGTRTANGINNVTIIARGQNAMSPDLTETSDVAIGKITIGNRVENAQILAGHRDFLGPINGNAQIGPVKVGGDWIASSLVAGVQDGGTAGFGDAGDTVIAGGTIAKIASITIKGTVSGSSTDSEQFGFVSHTIGSFKAANLVLPLTITPLESFNLALPNSSVAIREV